MRDRKDRGGVSLPSRIDYMHSATESIVDHEANLLIFLFYSKFVVDKVQYNTAVELPTSRIACVAWQIYNLRFLFLSLFFLSNCSTLQFNCGFKIRTYIWARPGNCRGVLIFTPGISNTLP